MKHLSALTRHRFFRFLVVGGSGAALNIGITFLLTHFVLGAERYFTAFLVGTIFNFFYSFTFYTVSIFKTRERHAERFVAFSGYGILMTVVQLYLVHQITAFVGATWYLPVIASVIFVGACVNYVVFKSSIFKVEDITSRPTSSGLPPANLVP